jgi:hypothetical protein
MSECIEHKDCDFGCGACNWHEAVEFERDRIIKILESKQCRTCDFHSGECDAFIQDVDLYISLIKGETNAAV